MKVARHGRCAIITCMIIKLGIAEHNNTEIVEVDGIQLVAGKGVVGDRHSRDFNDPFCHLTIIESESIDEYNKKHGLDIPYIDFRRNIVTRGIKLNELVGKKIDIGHVQLEVIDMCRPCRHLAEKLHRDDIIKEFLRKGGIRCEILTDGAILVGDQIR